MDNASTDCSAQVARGSGAAVLRLDRNLGFSAANNRALQRARGTFVAFVNPDVVVGFDDLERLESCLRERRRIVAPQLVNPDGSPQPNGRGIPTLARKLAHRLPVLPRSRDEFLLCASVGELRPVAWSMGAAVCARTDLIREIGGWDEGFFLYYEDHELGLRAWKSGVEYVVDGSTRWTHEWARATTRLAWTPWKHELRSATCFYRKYPRVLVGRLRGDPLLADIESKTQRR